MLVTMCLYPICIVAKYPLQANRLIVAKGQQSENEFSTKLSERIAVNLGAGSQYICQLFSLAYFRGMKCRY